MISVAGLNIPVKRNFQFRPVEIDYLMTRFTNQFNNSSQNNFRYSAGANFTFGEASTKTRRLFSMSRRDGREMSLSRRLLSFRNGFRPTRL